MLLGGMSPRQRVFALGVVAAAIAGAYHDHLFSLVEAASVNQNGLNVSEIATRLAIDADSATISSWQKDVENSRESSRQKIASAYPMQASRSSLHQNAKYSLKEAPKKTFKYVGEVSTNILDFVCLEDGTKRMVTANSVTKSVMVLDDPIKNAAELIAVTDGLLAKLSSQGSSRREAVDKMAASAEATINLLKGGLAADSIEELEASEKKATAAMETAKNIMEQLFLADEEAVKQLTLAGLQLNDATKFLENSGTEASIVRKALNKSLTTLSHLISSMGVENHSSKDYVKRAKEDLSKLGKDYQSGMEKLKLKREVLEQVQGSEALFKKFNEEMESITRSKATLENMRSEVTSGLQGEDILKLQRVLTSVYTEREKVRVAVLACETLLKQLTLKYEELYKMVEGMADKQMKVNGEATLRSMDNKITYARGELVTTKKEAIGLLADLPQKISQNITLLLNGVLIKLDDGRVWLKQSSTEEAAKIADAEQKSQEATALLRTFSQLQRNLLDNIAKAQVRIDEGETNWDTIDRKFSLEARAKEAMNMMTLIKGATQRVTEAVAAAETLADAFFKKTEQILPKLSGSASMAKELADLIKAEKEAIQQLVKWEDGDGLREEETRCDARLEISRNVGTRSSGITSDINQRVSDLKSSLDDLRSPPSTHRRTSPSRGAVNPPPTGEIIEKIKAHRDSVQNLVLQLEQSMEKARNGKAQLDGLKDTLRKAVESVKEALSREPLEAFLNKLSSAPSDGMTTTPQGGKSGNEANVQNASPQGQLARLATEVHDQIRLMLTAADQLVTGRDAAETAQLDAGKSLINLHLLLVKVVVSEDADDAQRAEANALMNTIRGMLTALKARLAEEGVKLKEFKAQTGDSEVLKIASDEGLREVAAILQLAESRLEELLKAGIQILNAQMTSAQTAAERLYKESRAASKSGDLTGEVVGRLFSVEAAGTANSEAVRTCSGIIESLFLPACCFILECAYASSSGQASNASSAVATEFKECEQRARQTAEFLQAVAGDVENCARIEMDSIKAVDAFRSKHSVSASSISAYRRTNPGHRFSLTLRRLSASSPTPTSDVLLDQAEKLAARAAAARAQLSRRLAHLEKLRNSGQNPPPPQPNYDLDQGADRKTPDGTPPSPSPAKPANGKNEKTNPLFIMAITLVSAVLLLLVVFCCWLYIHKRRTKVDKLKEGASKTLQYKPGDGAHEPPFFSSTLDTEDTARRSSDHMDLFADGKPKLTVELGGIAAVPNAEVVMGDLEAGAVLTTNMQYLVDEHHTVAKELCRHHLPGCHTPLAYVFSSTPTDMRSPRDGFTTPGVRTPPLWESPQRIVGDSPRGKVVRGRSASPAMR